MSEDRGKLVEDVFLQVSQAGTGDRAALLERLSNGDAELKKEVESLLQHHEASSDFLDSSDALAMAARADLAFLSSSSTNAAVELYSGTTYAGPPGGFRSSSVCSRVADPQPGICAMWDES